MSNIFKSALLSARQIWFQQRKKGLRARILRYYGEGESPEVRDVMAHIKKHPEKELPLGMTPPYEWVGEYLPQSVQVDTDKASGLPFVTATGHRIFFREIRRSPMCKAPSLSRKWNRMTVRHIVMLGMGSM